MSLPTCPRSALEISATHHSGVLGATVKDKTNQNHTKFPGSPNGRVLQVGVEGLSHDLRGERCLAWATLYVQVRCVAQGMHSGIRAARDSEPDRLDRVQPLGSLLRERYRQAATAMAKARGTVKYKECGQGLELPTASSP